MYDEENYKTDPEYNCTFWDDVDYILSNFERLISIDEKKKYKKELASEMDVIDRMLKEQQNRLDDIEECYKIDGIINEITSYKFNEEISKSVKRDFRGINPFIINFFEEVLGCNLLSLPGEHRCMHRDMTIRYLDKNSNLKSEVITKCKSLKEIEDILEKNKGSLFEKIDNKAKNKKPVDIIKRLLGKQN